MHDMAAAAHEYALLSADDFHSPLPLPGARAYDLLSADDFPGAAPAGAVGGGAGTRAAAYLEAWSCTLAGVIAGQHE